jgi:hypothetical protein
VAPAEGGPPRFLYGEVVHVTAGDVRTVAEANGLEPRRLAHEDLVVDGASPTGARDGWILHLRAPRLERSLDLPEGLLQPTGWIEVAGESGEAEQVPLEASRHRPWRDDVMLELAVEASTDEGARALAARVEQRLRELAPGVPLGLAPPEDLGPAFDLTFWLYPLEDALELFERITSGPGWRPAPNDGVFPAARWEPVGGGFMDERAVRSAEFTYRCWTSPARRA